MAMCKFKIGEIVVCHGQIFMVQDISELGCNGTQYLLDNGNWYYESELE